MDDRAFPDDLVVDVSLEPQSLALVQGANTLLECKVSTAKNGPGEIDGSGCTPRGWHLVHAKFGAECQANTVFVARRPTGEVYSAELAATHPGRDWMLTRIIWLSGCEPGRNQGGSVDTLRRFIYLHGCPDEVELGKPGSGGCIRMSNVDVMRLYVQVRI